MSAADRTEKVLRDIHVLFSKAEPYNGSKRDVIVNKNEMMDLLKELNACMYDIDDEHELSQTKKDKANREMQKQGDDIIFAASRKAEDIYAASIMYTDNALNDIQQIIEDAGGCRSPRSTKTPRIRWQAKSRPSSPTNQNSSRSWEI